MVNCAAVFCFSFQGSTDLLVPALDIVEIKHLKPVFVIFFIFLLVRLVLIKNGKVNNQINFESIVQVGCSAHESVANVFNEVELHILLAFLHVDQ